MVEHSIQSLLLDGMCAECPAPKIRLREMKDRLRHAMADCPASCLDFPTSWPRFLVRKDTSSGLAVDPPSSNHADREVVKAVNCLLLVSP
eukprot:6035018-Amphidinium_carterae.2